MNIVLTSDRSICNLTHEFLSILCLTISLKASRISSSCVKARNTNDQDNYISKLVTKVGEPSILVNFHGSRDFMLFLFLL